MWVLQRVTEIVLIARIIPIWRSRENHWSAVHDERGAAVVTVGPWWQFARE